MQSHIDYAGTISRFEIKIRSGEITKVREGLRALRCEKIPRPFLVEIANLARRVKMEAWGLRIMQPLIHPKNPTVMLPSNEERAEYSARLLKIGAVPEAKKTLLSCGDQQSPNVVLYLATAHMLEWDYEAAIPFLKKYCELPKISGAPFSTSQAAETLGISKSCARELLKTAILDGIILVTGAGRSVVYRF